MNHFDELLEYHKQKALEGNKYSRKVVEEWEQMDYFLSALNKANNLIK